MTRARDDRVSMGVTVVLALSRMVPIRRQTTLTRKNSRIAAAAIPAAIPVGLLAAGLIWLIYYSLHEYVLGARLAGGGWSLDQYTRIFTGPSSSFYITVLLRTVGLSLMAVVLSIIAATPVAYAIVRTRSESLRWAMIGLCLVPFLMGDVIRAFGWLLLLGRTGAYGWTTDGLGLGPMGLVGTSTSVLLGIVQTITPICVLILAPSVRRVNLSFEDAAATLGAGRFSQWYHVILPLMRPGFVAAGLAGFALLITQFAIPQLLGDGQKSFAANAIYDAYFGQGNINLGSALGVIVLLIVMVSIALGSLFGERQNREKGE